MGLGPGRNSLSPEHPVLAPMRRVLEALQPRGVQRLRRLEDGDELDLNAAITAAVDRRPGRQPDPRVMMRLRRVTRDVAVLLLLDLSASLNDPTEAEGTRLLDLTRAATVLMAEAVHRVGDPVALQGFCPDGRHDVFYQRFKDFAEDWGPMAKARLAGMEGQLSTRMGAAIRHAGRHLGQQHAALKLLLVLTDGAPADIDERAPAHLRHDARVAVTARARQACSPSASASIPRRMPMWRRSSGRAVTRSWTGSSACPNACRAFTPGSPAERSCRDRSRHDPRDHLRRDSSWPFVLRKGRCRCAFARRLS
ncbi:hypothetical protein PUH89_08425 [Rhodobacter capsulatus]|nr:hypothetical protein [Rhodobacter capsulatus]WER10984.1 hypothetical protein PUH89_08425 [Rhodobacter capsulatus]